MLINNLIIRHIISSIFFSCLLLFSIFFIFSILENLGENYSFIKILILSIFLTSQILCYVPLLVFLLFLIFFILKLKTHNELLIIFHYYSFKKFLIVFLPIIILFTFFELNKNYAIDELEKFKNNLSINNYSKTKTLINTIDKNNKKYLIIGQNENKIENLNEYLIKDGELIESIFSDDITFENNDIILNSYFILRDNNFKQKFDKKIILNNALFFMDSTSSIQYIYDNYWHLLNPQNIYKTIINFLILNLIIVILLNKNYIDKKSNHSILLLGSITLIIYNYFILNTNLIIFDGIFKMISILLIIVLIQKLKYE